MQIRRHLFVASPRDWCISEMSQATLTDRPYVNSNLFAGQYLDARLRELRDTATKTNSLVDRLEALTLPEPDDVADGLERYIEAKERAAELDAKIERTDEIVYELYGLTEEEIEIVEEAVRDD